MESKLAEDCGHGRARVPGPRGAAVRPDAQRTPRAAGRGERSRSQLHFKLAGSENVVILAVNALAVNSLAVNGALPL